MQGSLVEIKDVTHNPALEFFLYRCIFHRKEDTPTYKPYRKHRERHEYLESAIPKGFHMKVLFWKGDHVGMIAYGLPKASGLPIIGDKIIVMNCIWVHRRAQGRGFGRLLMDDMMESEKKAVGFATIALENYWMLWIQKEMMERLGFHSVKSIKMKHKTYKKGRCFTIHLMWLPTTKNVSTPTWDESQLLYGVDFCHHHPLYWGKYGCAKQGLKEIHEKC